MPFTMSGNNDGWSFNRFDEYEAKQKQAKEISEEEVAEETITSSSGTTKVQSDGSSVHKGPSSGKKMTAKPTGPSPFAKVSEETVEEGIDFKGAAREQARRDKIQAEKDKKSPSSKDYRLAMRKFRPGASQEERAEGGRDVMREKGTSPIKNGKKMFEDLQATGLFSVEEIEALVEASCGSKGYQEGGEVKCDKCEGKGCDHCKGKGTHSKKEKGAKPDYLDFDKDGNKEEPMKDALKEKGGKKS